MEDVEMELNDITIDTTNELPMLSIEDNNLNLFLDDTIDLNVVIKKVKENE